MSATTPQKTSGGASITSPTQQWGGGSRTAGPVSAPVPSLAWTQGSVNWTKLNNPAASTQALPQNQAQHKLWCPCVRGAPQGAQKTDGMGKGTPHLGGHPDALSSQQKPRSQGEHSWIYCPFCVHLGSAAARAGAHPSVTTQQVHRPG